MFGYLNHSLLLRAGLAMGLLTVLAVGGMASAVFVARSTYGEAAAVNQAGSLRMQSYHIAAALEAVRNGRSQPFGGIQMLTAEFEQRLTSPRLADVVNTSSRKSIQQAYGLITERWQRDILPLLRGSMERSADSFVDESLVETRQAFRAMVGGFVADIDNLVRLLEEDAESRIHLLGLFQGVSLFLTLAVAIATLYLLYTDVLSPLHDLLNSAERAGRGDFNVRVGHTGPDELGRLGQAFNTMAADLSTMYGELEDRVSQKTEELILRNRSLELLYKASQRLTVTTVSDTTYRELLDEVRGVLGCEAITLCMSDEDGKHTAYILAGSGPIPPMCKRERCDLCLGDGKIHLVSRVAHGGKNDIRSIPVRDQENTFGVILVEQKNAVAFQPWQTQVLETLGKNIGISIGVNRRVTQRRRLALMDERGVIARELHDSLAQSLSYLKIQVTRLFFLRDSDAELQQFDQVLGELKEGLDTAYRQLRELLTTFRLQMDDRGLAKALSEAVAEFNARGEVEIRLDNQMKNCPCTVNEEIHLLQIVRETLANIVHHSGANHALVSIKPQDDRSILLCVEDNGIGISPKAERTHHYGLAILHERASSLNAQLRISSRPEGGTRVSLQFQPSSVQAETTHSSASLAG